MGTGIGIIVFLFILYFVPTMVAISRKHKQQNPISIINFLLGWTIIGWIICLAWSVSDNKEK